MLRGKSPCLWAESVSGRPLDASLAAGGDASEVELQRLDGVVRSSTVMPWTFDDGRQPNGAHSPHVLSQSREFSAVFFNVEDFDAWLYVYLQRLMNSEGMQFVSSSNARFRGQGKYGFAAH